LSLSPSFTATISLSKTSSSSKNPSSSPSASQSNKKSPASPKKTSPVNTKTPTPTPTPKECEFKQNTIEYLRECNTGFPVTSDIIKMDSLTRVVDNPKQPINLPLSIDKDFVGSVNIPGGLLYKDWSIR